GLGVFLLGTGLIYLFISGEVTGATLMLVCSGLGGIVGYYLWFTARRLDDLRPEDKLDGNIEDGAGELGFFPPHSWWPVTMAGGCALVVLGTIFGLWLIVTGAVVTLWAISGFVMEYYSGLPDDVIPPH
ncbi:MAG: hypothetical protein QOH99_1161, partial [Frankiaceae bacterium]|nr:hypothetical protein [Frankiaceae bacterium]